MTAGMLMRPCLYMVRRLRSACLLAPAGHHVGQNLAPVRCLLQQGQRVQQDSVLQAMTHEDHETAKLCTISPTQNQ
eukprot:12932219-Prorocentrum_lima.AAC.1